MKLFKRPTERGETIVEVLIIAAILSAVLGTAFASSSRTLKGSRQAQERSEGAAVAQTQIERLKSYVSSNEESTDPKFCISDQNVKRVVTTPVPSNSPAADYFTQYPNECRDAQGRYYSVIVYDPNTRLYTVDVQWDNAVGTGRDNVQLKYRTAYLNDPVAVVPATPPGPPALTSGQICTAQVPNNMFHGCYFNSLVDQPCAGLGSNFAAQNDTGSPTGLVGNYGTGSPAAGVNNDIFSACWNGSFNFATTGYYVFNIVTDDGMRVFVDGALILDKYSQQAPTSYQIGLNLTAGNHNVKIEYYEAAGGATAIVSWAVAEQLPRTGLVWVDLTEANLSNSVANARAATNKAYCWQVFEYWDINNGFPYDGWDNNYLCSNNDLGITWKQDGVIPGQFCYQWGASPEDPDTWNDNYLCANQPLGVEFSKTGVIAGKSCISIRENLDSEPALWRPPSGSVRLCENPTLPIESLVEGESFDTGGCRTPVGDGAASAGAGMSYCTVSTGTKTIQTADFSTLVFRGRGDYYLGWPQATITIDGVTVFTGDINSSSLRDFYITGLKIPSGTHTFTVSFNNDACGCSGAYTDRNLFFDKLDFYRDDVVGEFEAETLTPVGGGIVSEARGGASAGQVKKYYAAGSASRTVKTGRVKAINIRALSDQWMGPAQMTLRVDGNPVWVKSVTSTDYAKQQLTGLNIAPGDHTFAISFDNDACGDTDPCGAQPNQDRNLILDKIEFTEAETLADGNVALNKTIWPAGSPASSDSRYRQGDLRDANDNNQGTMWYPAAFGYVNNIDLGAAYNLRTISASWRSFGYSSFITSYTIQYSVDGSTWITARSGGTPGEDTTTATGTYSNARYLRVTANSTTNWIGIYEIKAYE